MAEVSLRSGASEIAGWSGAATARGVEIDLRALRARVGVLMALEPVQFRRSVGVSQMRLPEVMLIETSKNQHLPMRLLADTKELLEEVPNRRRSIPDLQIS